MKKLSTFLENSVFIIAELSANHAGKKEVAIETIKAAKRAGANAIKLQTYTADTMTLKSDAKDFLIDHETVWDGRYLHDLYKEASTPWEWHKELFNIANEEGLICFSSPFDFTAVDFLESLDNPIYKIASLEITDIPLIEYIAQKEKPMIISTGIATLEDIELALDACKRMGNNQVSLLKCTSSYPAPIEEANLSMIKDLAIRFNVASGLSDHTLGITAPVIAVTQGAKIIEKHFILDRSIGGVDASFSLDEKEFKQMVTAVREAEVALGKVDYNLTEKQCQGRNFSRSLYIAKDVKKGEVVTNENVRSVRPGFGMHPKHLPMIIGKTFVKDFTSGTRMKQTLIQ
ncbi:pseudaminic acid synthase [Flavobacteriaceae bacterium]|nr:pseudaminic acid synthase [Flavobacteriaceae bacterium]